MGCVLVVEDDPAICEVVCDALRERGLSVEAVATDMAAYRRLTDLPTIDALVLDVNLGPGATGYDIARFARQVIPSVVVIYVSGEVTPASFNAFGVPNSEFVQKPFRPELLADAVMRRLHATQTCH